MTRDQTRAAIRLGSSGGSKRALLIALVLGAIAAGANFLFLDQVQGTKLEILKAKKRINAGTKVTADMFTLVRIYGEDIAEMKALVVQEKDLDVFSQMPLAESLAPGQVLFQSSFRFDGKRGIRDEIGPDERAIALRVMDESSAVGYFVMPGDVVDVYANAGAGPENIIPRTVVRAVGDAVVVAGEASSRDGRYRTVTVFVPSNRVREILQKLETSKGYVTLALARNSAQ